MQFVVKSSFALLLCCASSALVAAISPAQTPPPKRAPARRNLAPIPITAFDFPLEPGDLLAVSVAGHAEMSASGLVINESGKITLPVVGNVAVAGKSLAQTQKLITGVYATQLRAPQVSVILLRPKPRQITLVGALARPGAFDLVSGWRLGNAIDAAGGLSAPIEDIIATFSRAKGTPQPFDLAAVVNRTQISANKTLLPGDVISLRLVPGRLITIVGDVKTPGLVMLRHGTRLANALIGAGGLPEPQLPETTEITLVRGAQKTSLSASGALADPGGKADVELQNGDVLSVRAIRTQVAVMSFHDLVKSAGSYTLQGQAGILRALLAAGGLTATPDQVLVSIRRGEGELPVDLEKATYDPKFDLALQNGDILLVSPLEGPRVQVAGSVTRPGQWNLKKGATILDALVYSGGLSLKPDQTKLNILRTQGEKQVVLNIDPVALIGLSDLGQNVRLQEGDMVMANPQAASSVFLSGEVLKPGPYQLSEGDGIIELLLRAGGPTPEARLKSVRVVHRDNSATTVDVSEAIKVEGARLPIELREGDLVQVPLNPKRVLVMNAVLKPGYYPIPETKVLTVGDAILLAGGAQGGARLQEVAILRRAADGGVNKRIVPINQIAGGKFTIDEPLSSGDVVYVPQGRVQQSKLSAAIGGLSAFNLFRSVVGQ